MLKITFKIKSSVRIKSSNARLVKIFRRIWFFNSIFFDNLKNKQTSIEAVNVHIRQKLKSNKLVLMRSPFHYKVSKTVLAQPLQVFYITFVLKSRVEHPVYFQAHVLNFLKNINNTNNYNITAIKILHKLC